MAIGIATIMHPLGIHVVVRNIGDAPMQDVVVHVTGNSYDLGTIGCGEQDRVKVRPSGESHVEISFLNSHGQQRRLVADCYFESRHYHGTITIDVSGDKLVGVQDSVSTGMY